MTIGSLFIALGFKVENADQLANVERGLTAGAAKAAKMTLGVGALNLAFLALVETSARAAQALQNFALTTGLSTDDLQIWQHAAQVAGLDANDLTTAIKQLQTARTNFALGEPQAVGAWALLGVDPRQDPFKVIQSLRENIGRIKDVGIQRNLLGRVGLESLIPLLRASNVEFEKWSRNFVITQKQIQILSRLNQAWSSLKASIVSVKTQFSVIFAPVAERVLRLFEWLAEKVADFVRWLESAGPVATALKWTLVAMAIALGLISVALVAITAALGLATAAMVAFDVVAAPIIPILAGISAIILVAAGAIGALILLIDDMWHAFTGGKSILADLGDRVFGPFFRWLFEMWDKVLAKAQTVTDFIRHPIDAIFSDDAAQPAQTGRGSATASQENNVNITIPGTGDPRQTGKATYDAFKGFLSAAAYQFPVPNW